jgi:hypothetical protein
MIIIMIIIINTLCYCLIHWALLKWSQGNLLLHSGALLTWGYHQAAATGLQNQVRDSILRWILVTLFGTDFGTTGKERSDIAGHSHCIRHISFETPQTTVSVDCPSDVWCLNTIYSWSFISFSAIWSSRTPHNVSQNNRGLLSTVTSPASRENFRHPETCPCRTWRCSRETSCFKSYCFSPI